jgi:hypothetical protein
MRVASLVASAALVVSCGGGEPASPTIGGIPFTPKDATAAVVPLSSFGIVNVRGSTAVVGITSAPSLCSTLASGKEPKSGRYLVLAPFQVQPDLSVSPPRTGDYPIGANARAVFFTTGTACDLGNVTEATAGKFTFTSVGNRYTGSYDLSFGADHITGNFDAPVCSGIDPFAIGQRALGCE